MVLLSLLNNCAITTESARITPTANIAFSLGLYLIIERGKLIPRTLLASLLWPDCTSIAARRSLRRAIWQLRSQGFPIGSTNSANVTLPKNAAETDVDRLAQQPDDDLATLDLNILPWFSPQTSDQFRDWIDDVRYITRTRISLLLQNATKRAQSTANWHAVARLANKSLELDPTCTVANSSASQAQLILQARSPRNVLNHLLLPLSQTHAPLLLGEQHLNYSPNVATPLIGREDQLMFLTTSLQHAIASKGSAIRISGALGIGKSKLIQTFTSVALSNGALVLESTLNPTNATLHLSSIAPLITALLNSPGAAGCQPKFSPLLTQFSASLPHHSLSLCQEALCDLIEAVSDEQPIVLVIKHAQWIDSLSLLLINQIALWITSRPVIIILSTQESSPQNAPPFISLHLNKLSQQHAITHAKNHIQILDKQLDDASLSWHLSVADGNPTQIEELLNHWAATGEARSAPATLKETFKSQIADLNPNAIRLIQTCAIFDDQATHERLLKALEWSPQVLLDATESLGDANLISTQNTQSPPTIRCKHDIIKEAALNSLSTPGRALLHSVAAAILEHEIANDPINHTSTQLRLLSAHHWHSAGESTRATQLGISLLAQLTNNSSTQEIINTCESTLNWCQTDNHRTAILKPYATTLYHLGEYERLNNAIATHAPPLENDEPRLKALELIHVNALSKVSPNWEPLTIRTLNCLTTPQATTERRIEAAITLSLLSAGLGNSDTINTAKRIIDPLLLHAHVPERSILRFQAITNALAGDTTTARQASLALATRARETQRAPAVLSNLIFASQCLHWCNAHDDSINVRTDAFSRASHLSFHHYAMQAALGISSLSLEHGDVEASRSWLEKAQELQSNISQFEAHSINLAEIKLAIATQDHTHARKLLKQAGPSLLNSQLPTRRATAHAVAIRSHLLRNGPQSKIKALTLKLHRLCSEFSTMRIFHYEFFTLYLAYTYLDDHDYATKIIIDYYKPFANEEIPQSHELATALKSLSGISFGNIVLPKLAVHSPLANP